MKSIHIPDERLLQFANQVGQERSTRLLAWIEENTPALYKAFASKNGLPVNTDARPMNAVSPEQQSTAKAAVALKIIRDLQQYLDGLNVPDAQTITSHNHDHDHGGCKCGGDGKCGGHCNGGGDGNGDNGGDNDTNLVFDPDIANVSYGHGHSPHYQASHPEE